jgi:hypothetical protein
MTKNEGKLKSQYFALNTIIMSQHAATALFYFITFSYSFIHQWLYSPLFGPGLFIGFVIFFTQTVGLLGRVISLTQGLYLPAWQHKHRINAYTDTHASCGKTVHDLDGAAVFSYNAHKFKVLDIMKIKAKAVYMTNDVSRSRVLRQQIQLKMFLPVFT